MGWRRRRTILRFWRWLRMAGPSWLRMSWIRIEGQSSGAVSSYTLDRAGARLTKINEVASIGGGTCHVAFDHTGRSAFAANYGGGSAASFSVGANGRLSPAVSFFQYSGHGPDAKRQKAPHAHRVTVSPDNRFLLVNDLGLDAIHIYRLDAATAKLTPNEPSAWRSAPGPGLGRCSFIRTASLLIASPRWRRRWWCCGGTRGVVRSRRCRRW